MNDQRGNNDPEQRDDWGRDRPDDSNAGDDPRYDTIIDVTGDQPEFVERELPPSTFFGRQTGEVRVWVAQGGTRGCLIPIGVVLLLLCCSCVGFWVIFDSLF